jgi:hypothetical protein
MLRETDKEKVIGLLIDNSHQDEFGCLLWTGSVTTKYGYGRVKIRGMECLAHRLAWELERGTIPDGMCVMPCKKAKNCIDVSHMELLSLADSSKVKESLTCKKCGSEKYRRPNGRLRCYACDEASRKAREEKVKR